MTLFSKYFWVTLQWNNPKSTRQKKSFSSSSIWCDSYKRSTSS